jgi:hypothetical protein
MEAKMDSKKRKQLNTVLSWGIGIGTAFIIVGETVYSNFVGSGFILLFGGSMLWLLFHERKSKRTKIKKDWRTPD